MVMPRTDLDKKRVRVSESLNQTLRNARIKDWDLNELEKLESQNKNSVLQAFINRKGKRKI